MVEAEPRQHRHAQRHHEGEPDLDDVPHPRQVLERVPRHRVPVPRAEREDRGHHPHPGEEEHPPVAAPEHRPDHGDDQHAEAEVAEAGEHGPLVAAEAQHRRAESAEAAGRHEAGQRGAVAGGGARRPDRAHEMGGSVQQEPQGVRQHDGRRAEGDGQAARRPPEPRRQLVGTSGRRPDDQEHQADEHGEGGDDQHLGADEELHDDEPGQREAVHPRPSPLGDQEVGQDQDDEGRDGQEGDVQLVERQFGHHERREPVGQSTDERGRRPPHPPAQQRRTWPTPTGPAPV